MNFNEYMEDLSLDESSTYHFDYNEFRYTIRTAHTNTSKFGIKDKHGDWEVYAKDDDFNPYTHGMKGSEMLTLIQDGIKHFTILDPVKFSDVRESRWRKFFRKELKHMEKINKRYVILKLHCGKRNALWNIERHKKDKAQENDEHEDHKHKEHDKHKHHKT